MRSMNSLNEQITKGITYYCNLKALLDIVEDINNKYVSPLLKKCIWKTKTNDLKIANRKTASKGLKGKGRRLWKVEWCLVNKLKHFILTEGSTEFTK